MREKTELRNYLHVTATFDHEVVEGAEGLETDVGGLNRTLWLTIDAEAVCG